MITAEYFLKSMRSFPGLPIVEPGGPNLCDFPLSQQMNKILMSNGITTSDVFLDHILAEGLCLKLLVPLSQIEIYADQRPLDPTHADKIKSSFNNDPLQHMLSHPVYGFPSNPLCFPPPPVDRASLLVLEDRRCQVTCFDGQHRLHALNAFCNEHNIPREHAFWLMHVFHPKLSDYKGIIKILMFRLNIQFDQKPTLVVDQLELSLQAASTTYSVEPYRPWRLHASFKTCTRNVDGIETFGPDRDVQHLIKHITTCPRIVEAAIKTKIYGNEFHLWRVSNKGSCLLSFLYTLQKSGLGPICANLIYAAAAFYRALEKKLGRSIRTGDFDGDKKGDTESDIMNKVAKQFDIPSIRLIPHCFEAIKPPKDLMKYITTCRNVLRVIVALVLGSEPLAIMWSPKGTPEYPQNPAHRPIDLLRERVRRRSGDDFQPEAWEKLLISYLNPTQSEAMLERWSKYVLNTPGPINNSLVFHDKRVRPEDREIFAERTLEFLCMDKQWYDVLSTTKILLPGDQLAINTLVPAIFPHYPPGQVTQIDDFMFKGGQHMASERTAAALPHLDPYHNQLDNTLPHLDPYHNQLDNTLPHLDQLNQPDNTLPHLDPYHNQLDINFSNWSDVNDFMAPNFIPNPQSMAFDTVFYEVEPDSLTGVLNPHPASTSLGLPASNLLGAFQLLPEPVQHRFTDPVFINNFISWAIGNRKRAGSGDNDSHECKRMRGMHWAEGGDDGGDDGGYDSGGEVPQSEDESYTNSYS